MNHNYSTTFSPFGKALLLLLVVVVAFATYNITMEANRVRAESLTTKAWILCKPGDYINLRMAPSKKSQEVGRLDPGDDIEIDGRTKDGFAHIVRPFDAWVWAGYIVFDEPQLVNETYVVVAKSRVACRRWCDGPQVASRPWLINGSQVKVYYLTDKWACTARGFIKTEWLEVDPQ